MSKLWAGESLSRVSGNALIKAGVKLYAMYAGKLPSSRIRITRPTTTATEFGSPTTALERYGFDKHPGSS